MKTLNNIRIIGIDHGYGNIKTANTITPTGVIPSANRPTFGSNILRCDGMYYSCGEGAQGVCFGQSERQRLLPANAHGRGERTPARRDFRGRCLPCGWTPANLGKVAARGVHELPHAKRAH